MGTFKKIVGSFTGESQSDAQSDAINAASDTTWKQYKQTRKDLLPFYQSAYRLLPYQEEAYKNAMGDVNTLRGWATDTASSPWYKLQMNETTDALNKQLAARGLYNSGAGIEALRKNAEAISASEANNKYKYLSDAIGYGLGQSPQGTNTSAVNSLINAGTNSASDIASLQLASGQNRAGYYNQLSSLLGGGLGGGLSAGMSDGLTGLLKGIGLGALGL